MLADKGNIKSSDAIISNDIIALGWRHGVIATLRHLKTVKPVASGDCRIILGARKNYGNACYGRVLFGADES